MVTEQTPQRIKKIYSDSNRSDLLFLTIQQVQFDPDCLLRLLSTACLQLKSDDCTWPYIHGIVTVYNQRN